MPPIGMPFEVPVHVWTGSRSKVKTELLDRCACECSCMACKQGRLSLTGYHHHCQVKIIQQVGFKPIVQLSLCHGPSPPPLKPCAACSETNIQLRSETNSTLRSTCSATRSQCLQAVHALPKPHTSATRYATPATSRLAFNNCRTQLPQKQTHSNK